MFAQLCTRCHRIMDLVLTEQGWDQHPMCEFGRQSQLEFDPAEAKVELLQTPWRDYIDEEE
jgi:hypothetical protein